MISSGSTSGGTTARCGRASAPTSTRRLPPASPTSTRTTEPYAGVVHARPGRWDGDLPAGERRGRHRVPGSRTWCAVPIIVRTSRCRALTEALGATPPEYIHHGLILGPHGGKLSKRDGHSSVADLRDEGYPAEAVRAYLDELGSPQHDVQLDVGRLRRLAIDAIAALPDEELAERVGVPVTVGPVLRGARTLASSRGRCWSSRTSGRMPPRSRRWSASPSSGAGARGAGRRRGAGARP